MFKAENTPSKRTRSKTSLNASANSDSDALVLKSPAAEDSPSKRTRSKTPVSARAQGLTAKSFSTEPEQGLKAAVKTARSPKTTASRAGTAAGSSPRRQTSKKRGRSTGLAATAVSASPNSKRLAVSSATGSRPVAAFSLRGSFSRRVCPANTAQAPGKVLDQNTDWI